MTYTANTDLNEVTEKVFENLNILLDSFELEYEEDARDRVFMPCPIHGGDNKKGLSICKNRKVWACWTHSCHESYGQSIFGFVSGLLSRQKNKKVSFGESLKYITSLYKMKNVKAPKRKTQQDDEFLNIAEAWKSISFDKENPECESIESVIPSKYFIKRGFEPETLKYFEVGDSIKNRASIPIHNQDGLLVGYIFRATKPYITPKFIFTDGIKKTKLLYNYHRAITSAREKNCLFLTEGQGDVWRLYEAGVYNVISIFGKDISDDQITLLLMSGITRLVVVTDDDQAGRESKVSIKRKLDRTFTLYFPIFDRKDIGQMTVDDIKEIILPQTKGLY
jgi:5S rRNA maturation endonuclease (ribonuclease M5)